MLVTFLLNLLLFDMHNYLFAVENPDCVQAEILFKCAQFVLTADRHAGRQVVTQGDDAILVIVVLGQELQLEPIELILSKSSLEESPELLKIVVVTDGVPL